jgi:hypothetical protein
MAKNPFAAPARRRGRPGLCPFGIPAQAVDEIRSLRSRGETWGSILSSLSKKYKKSERTLWRWLEFQHAEDERGRQLRGRMSPEATARSRAIIESLQRWKADYDAAQDIQPEDSGEK